MDKSILKKVCLYVITACLVSCNGDFGEVDEPEEPSVNQSGRVHFKEVDYRPAPGQFVNEMPPFEAGDTQQSINAKVLDMLNKGSLVSLGALGGQITLTLAEPIYCDRTKDADFRVLGNAYLTGSMDGLTLGSAEPGMVWIMEDTNGNGIADDKWYCFMGEMIDEITKVEITYTEIATPTSAQWVKWQCNDGTEGFLTCNTAYHDHTYFPQWQYKDASNASMTLTAYKVPANGFVEPSSGLVRQICYPGFADCYPNNDPRSAFSIRDAVDVDGNKADITRIDFIRVVTAVIDSNGPLGETSTEIGGVEILD
ncbi:MAG: hypothetical protein J1F20_01625 [Muribaculaceae bacterium]|nr:hypothetical protein [Muribaculaceae bacterium]